MNSTSEEPLVSVVMIFLDAERFIRAAIESVCDQDYANWELLLVDELSLGLAPRLVEELLERLKPIRRELGLTVLLVEQNAHVALANVDYGYVIENGRIVLDGDPERLSGHQDVQEFYLGGAAGKRRSYRAVKQYRRSRRWYG